MPLVPGGGLFLRNHILLIQRVTAITILFAATVGLAGSNALAAEPANNYYVVEAIRLKAEAKEHEGMAAEYDKNPMGHPGPRGQAMGTPCRNLMKKMGMQAKQAGAVGAMHEDMANKAQ